MAGPTHEQRGAEALFERVNVQGTRHVLEAAAAAGVMHLVHMSSLAVHPYCGHAHGDDSTPRGWDLNAYTRSKNRAEDIVQSFRDRLRVTVNGPGRIDIRSMGRVDVRGTGDYDYREGVKK